MEKNIQDALHKAGDATKQASEMEGLLKSSVASTKNQVTALTVQVDEQVTL
jgi:hypothetical protein